MSQPTASTRARNIAAGRKSFDRYAGSRYHSKSAATDSSVKRGKIKTPCGLKIMQAQPKSANATNIQTPVSSLIGDLPTPKRLQQWAQEAQGRAQEEYSPQPGRGNTLLPDK